MKLKIHDVGVVVAERRLSGRHNGRPCELVLKIGKPFPDEEQESCWYCPYSISGGNDERLFYGAGVDSLQEFRGAGPVWDGRPAVDLALFKSIVADR